MATGRPTVITVKTLLLIKLWSRPASAKHHYMVLPYLEQPSELPHISFVTVLTEVWKA